MTKLIKHPLYLVKWIIDGVPDSPMEKDFNLYNRAVEFAEALQPKDNGVIYELTRLAHYENKGRGLK